MGDGRAERPVGGSFGIDVNPLAVARGRREQIDAILLDLGVKEMVLLSNSQKSVVALEGFGLKIVGQKPFPIPSGR